MKQAGMGVLINVIGFLTAYRLIRGGWRAPKKPCLRCDGTGEVFDHFAYCGKQKRTIRRTCPVCNGKGWKRR